MKDEQTSIAPKNYRSKQAEREAKLAPAAKAEAKDKDAMRMEAQEIGKEAEKAEDEITQLKKRIAELEKKD